MMHGLSRWHFPIVTVADRVGSRLFLRLPNRKSATLEPAMKPLAPGDAVLCSDGGNGYKDLAAARSLEHFVVGSKPGTRVAASCYHIQNVNSLHARYGEFIELLCGPATKNLNGYIRWPEARMTRVQLADVISAS